MRVVSPPAPARIRRIHPDRAGECTLMEDIRPDRLLLAWLAAALFMQVLWFVQRRHRDAGIVDVGWAASLGAMAVAYALLGSGSFEQRLLAGAVGGFWGLRLALHLLFDRVIGKQEDGRYRYLREHWGARADAQFVWFFQLQALVAAILSLPFLLMAANPEPGLASIQWFGLLLFAGAKVGEAVADRQLARFRAEPSNRGTTCRDGLWRYSRHPNYFFEWLVWCAFAALAWPAPYGAWALLMPALMYVLVTRVSGIPYTEAQALRSRGEDYRRYQRTTSPLIPWFPKEERA
jgi:steroid 5-alpha reductase family enzyme